MSDILSYTVNGQEFYHHGIKGMKWGVRRFQTKDGSLTPAGKKRYVTAAQGVRNANQAAKDARKKSLAESRATDSGIGSYRRAVKKASTASKEAYRDSIAKDKTYNKQLRAEKKAAKENPETERKGLSDKQKTALKVGAAVAGTALATYGAYKLNDYVKTKNCQIAAMRGEEYAHKMFKSELNAFAARGGLNAEGTNMAYRKISVSRKNAVTNAVNSAKGDSFAKAAKNVIGYKKSGGSLDRLASVDFYKNLPDFEAEFRKYKR